MNWKKWTGFDKNVKKRCIIFSFTSRNETRDLHLSTAGKLLPIITNFFQQNAAPGHFAINANAVFRSALPERWRISYKFPGSFMSAF